MNGSKGLMHVGIRVSVLLASLILVSAATAATPTMEKFRLGFETRPWGIAGGPDGNLWFVESGLGTFGGNMVGRITPSGSITEFRIPTEQSAPTSITTGPDGNLWFTESMYGQSSGKIGRISPSSFEIEEFPVAGTPKDITAGPDGALWFTQGSSAVRPYIGRITPNGQITRFPVPTWPTAITSGLDGHLWITGNDPQGGDAPVVVRMTRIGEVSVFPLSAPSRPGGIAVGPEGNLWFTQGYEKGIGRITPNGDVKDFPIGPHRASHAIALGPDGNLWFTSSDSGRPSGAFIGRLTPDGHLTWFAIGAGYAPGVASGPDGNIWFTSFTPMGAIYNIVGRIVPGIPSIDAGMLTMVAGQRWASLRLNCGGGSPRSACRGTLRLTAFYRRGRHFKAFRVAHRRYTMPSGSKRVVALRLTRKALRATSRRRSHLGVWIGVTTRGLESVRRWAVLKIRHPSTIRGSRASLAPAKALHLPR